MLPRSIGLMWSAVNFLDCWIFARIGLAILPFDLFPHVGLAVALASLGQPFIEEDNETAVIKVIEYAPAIAGNYAIWACVGPTAAGIFCASIFSSTVIFLGEMAKKKYYDGDKISWSDTFEIGLRAGKTSAMITTLNMGTDKPWDTGKVSQLIIDNVAVPAKHQFFAFTASALSGIALLKGLSMFVSGNCCSKKKEDNQADVQMESIRVS